MKLFNWLFGSTHSEKEMKPFASKGGNFVSEKSNKERDNSVKGEFNITICYDQQNLLTKEGEVKNTEYRFGVAFSSWEQMLELTGLDHPFYVQDVSP